MYWQIPLALVLISVKWWENFVDKTKYTAKLFELKKEIQRVRVKMATVTSLWSILFVIGFVYVLEYIQVSRLTQSANAIVNTQFETKSHFCLNNKKTSFQGRRLNFPYFLSPVNTTGEAGETTSNEARMAVLHAVPAIIQVEIQLFQRTCVISNN